MRLNNIAMMEFCNPNTIRLRRKPSQPADNPVLSSIVFWGSGGGCWLGTLMKRKTNMESTCANSNCALVFLTCLFSWEHDDFP